MNEGLPPPTHRHMQTCSFLKSGGWHSTESVLVREILLHATIGSGGSRISQMGRGVSIPLVANILIRPILFSTNYMKIKKNVPIVPKSDKKNFSKIFCGHMSFYGTSDVLVLDYRWCLLWVSHLFTLGRGKLDVLSWDWPLVWHLPTSLWPAWWSVTVPHMCFSAEVECWIQKGDLPHSSVMR